MGANSKIEWTDHTFNPWRGCTKVAAGCANCYAERDAERFPDKLGIWGERGTRVVAAESTWKEPLKWNKAAAAAGERQRVFCASLADVFEDWSGPIHDSNGNVLIIDQVGDWRFLWPEDEITRAFLRGEHGKRAGTMNDVRVKLFALIDATPNLDWLLLTKRPENIARMWCSHVNTDGSPPSKLRRPNVWLGTSIATQEDADQNIPELLKCRDLAPVLFVSAEPLLGPVEFSDVTKRADAVQQLGKKALAGIDWLICGGESGPGARPMHPDWARSLRDQGTAAGVPFFFKQWGEWGPFDECMRSPKSMYAHRDGTISDRHDGLAVTLKNYGKSKTGRMLDGREWNELPQAAGVTR